MKRRARPRAVLRMLPSALVPSTEKKTVGSAKNWGLGWERSSAPSDISRTCPRVVVMDGSLGGFCLPCAIGFASHRNGSPPC